MKASVWDEGWVPVDCGAAVLARTLPSWAWPAPNWECGFGWAGDDSSVVAVARPHTDLAAARRPAPAHPSASRCPHHRRTNPTPLVDSTRVCVSKLSRACCQRLNERTRRPEMSQLGSKGSACGRDAKSDALVPRAPLPPHCAVGMQLPLNSVCRIGRQYIPVLLNQTTTGLEGDDRV